MTGSFWTTYGSAVAAFAAASLTGVVLDQLLYRALRSRFVRAGWAPGITLAAALHGLPTALGVLIGLYMAERRVALPPSWEAFTSAAWQVVFVAVGTAFAARILGRMVHSYTRRAGSRIPASSIFVNLTRGIVWVLGGLSMLAAVGVSITPLITALGVGGLAVGLALQPTLENLISGVQVLASRQIEPGDFIRLETGEEGTVLDVTWRNTAVQRLSKEIVIVPNSVIGRSIVTNFSSGGTEYVLGVPLTVDYGSDLELVERIALEVAREVVATVEDCVADAEPSVRFAGINPPTVTVNTFIQVTSYPARVAVRHEFIKRLQRRLREENVEAPPVSLGQAPV